MFNISVISDYIKKHEKIIIIGMVLFVSFYLGNKYINYEANKADEKVAILQNQINKDQQLLSQQEQQTQLDRQQYQQALEKLTKQNQALLNTIEEDNKVLKQNQQVDANLPLPDLANRWKVLADIQDNIITSPTGITVTEPAARLTVQQLEKVPVLTDQLNKETQVANNNQDMLNKSQVLNNDLTKQLDSANILLSDTKKKCDAQISQVKADSHKKERNWFLRGLGIGAASAAYVFVHFGI